MFGMSSGRLPGVSHHDFSMVPRADIPRSQFNRSRGLKTAFNSGYLVPILWDEVLPGDTINCKMSSFARLSTPIKPVMDNLYLDVFFFFVPNRLLWTNWKKFMGEQANPGDSISYLVPKVTSPTAGFAVGSLFDYFGLPTVGQVGGGNTVTVNALHTRAYNFIWNEWFRDQNLQNSVTFDQGDGPDTYSNYNLLKRGKRHDYFTSCLPSPQKGSAVTMPLGTTAPVAANGNIVWQEVGTPGNKQAMTGNWGTGHWDMGGTGGTGTWGAGAAQYYSGLQADLSNATAATINSLRQAFQIQRLLERDARGGTRYTEIIRSHFNVVSPDFRLQRPEYLGGGSTQITFTPIPQTSVTGTTPQGNLAAMATHSSSGMGFVKSFTEHGVLIGLASVRADLSYQQGLHRMWSRQTRYDFYWPALSHIGEQAVLNQEIYCDGSANDAQTFGYQERHGEYRYGQSAITGILRSTAASTLDIWHLAQKFTSLPTLGTTFIQEAPPVDRIVAVNTEPQIYFDAYFDMKWARPMPMYSVPGFIDRF